MLSAAVVAVVWTSYDYLYPLFRPGNLIFKTAAAADEVDKTPPQISDIAVAEVSPTSTTITWTTDKEADSLVNFNISRDYGITRDSALTKTHKIVVPDLNPSQQYYYRIISVDKNGNQNISNDFIFTTKDLETKTTTPETPPIETPTQTETPTQNLGPGNGPGEGGGYKEPPQDETQVVKETINLLDQINDEESLSLIESKIQQVAEEKAKPPVITGDFAKVEVGTDFAKVMWKTDKESNSIVALASDAEYAPNAANPYRWKEGEPNQMVLVHEVVVTGLRPATTYHYQVLSKSTLGLESASEDNTFKTKSILPEIFNINVSKVQEDSATIDFNTNVPCSSIIEYTDLSTNATKLEGSTAVVNAHSIQLKNLKFDSYYSAVIKVENEQGEKVLSQPITFTTIKDIQPPVISKVNTESTLYPGTDNKTQTIISWRTDEGSMCQFFYGQGLASSKDASTLPKEEDYITNHVQVVTEFQPATVYKFWIECYDKTKNRSKSEDYTMLTPTREQSILDLIIKNFEGTFGWLKKK
jgi:hypothetical protein